MSTRELHLRLAWLYDGRRTNLWLYHLRTAVDLITFPPPLLHR